MKSHASDLVGLATCIYKDAVAKCTAVDVNLRDIQTLESRVKHEGISFLTITLPSMGKDFERSLAQGMISPTAFRAFRKVGTIPAFLRGMFEKVFDLTTGGILNEPDIAAIVGIRQMAYSFKKLRVECTSTRTQAAFTEFRQCEHDLERLADPDVLKKFENLSRVLWSSVFSDLGIVQRAVPKHGPGATAERISGNQKFRIRSWHERLEPYFTLFDYAYSLSAYQGSEFQNVTLVSEEEELPVRVISVPKTLKGPRIIAIEPVCMQYTQQALSREIVRSLESSRITAGHVNFTDQSINRSLALIGSKTGYYATLDLSSASDRVPLHMVKRMLSCHQDLLGAILACRSSHAQLPDGSILLLRKFASMGSALCFPIESMYFYTICIMALLEVHNLPCTPENIYLCSREVYIYGDDIIVPSDVAVAVSNRLASLYCKVNADKSFWTGKFRESCGMDAFMGEEVTPIYIRETRPRDRQSVKALISWVETSNLLYKQGYWLASSHMISHVERLLGPLPVVGEECSGLGKVTFGKTYSSGRMNKSYQAPEVRTWVPTPVYRTDKLDGYSALQKCLLSLEVRPTSEPAFEEDHLCRTARHGAATLKRRWVQPY